MPDSSAPNPPAVAPLSGVCQSRNFKIQYVRSSPRACHSGRKDGQGSDGSRHRCMRLDDGNLLRWSSIRNRRCTQPPSKGAVGARPGACGHPSRSPDRCRRRKSAACFSRRRLLVPHAHLALIVGGRRQPAADGLDDAHGPSHAVGNRRRRAGHDPVSGHYRIAGFLEGYAQKWSKKSGRLISDRLFETADEQRMKKIQFLKDLHRMAAA